MTDISGMVLRYDRKTIFLHWASALLVVLLWGIAQVIDFFPSGPMRVNVRSLHIALGVTLAVVVALRVVWRLREGRQLPSFETGLMGLAAHAAHYALYALLIAEVTLGLANTWVRGDSIFNLFAVPAFDPGNKALRRQVGDLHELVANLILIVAGVHAAAALFHHYVRHDGVLRRMLPNLNG